MNFSGTYKLGKHVHLEARHNEIPFKAKTSMSIFFMAMFLNSYTVNSYSFHKIHTLRLIYVIE